MKQEVKPLSQTRVEEKGKCRNSSSHQSTAVDTRASHQSTSLDRAALGSTSIQHAHSPMAQLSPLPGSFFLGS